MFTGGINAKTDINKDIKGIFCHNCNKERIVLCSRSVLKNKDFMLQIIQLL